jgi:hypothetical protein
LTEVVASSRQCRSLRGREAEPDYNSQAKNKDRVPDISELDFERGAIKFITCHLGFIKYSSRKETESEAAILGLRLFLVAWYKPLGEEQSPNNKMGREISRRRASPSVTASVREPLRCRQAC